MKNSEKRELQEMLDADIYQEMLLALGTLQKRVGSLDVDVVVDKLVTAFLMRDAGLL